MIRRSEWKFSHERMLKTRFHTAENMDRFKHEEELSGKKR